MTKLQQSILGKALDQFSFSENDIEKLNKDVVERRINSKIFQYLNENITYVKNKRKQKNHFH